MNKRLTLLGMCIATAFQLANNSYAATPLVIPEISQHAPKQVIFIDKNINNYQLLANDNNLNKIRNSSLVIPLDKNTNAIEQISNHLAHHKNLEAIHLISHGFSGGLTLGNNKVGIKQIKKHSSLLSNWKNALSENGDILLYGCNVAKDKVGRDFINTLATLTDADVAASDNTTGNPGVAQDWLLEKKTGTIETAALFDNTPHLFSSTLDIVDGNAFLYGNNIEVGIGPDGAFGSDVSSSEIGRKSYGKPLGYISDPSGNNFQNSYHGDFFLPGYPEEGWAISLDGKTYNNNSNIQGATIQGSLSDFINTTTNQNVTWKGSTEGLDISQVIRIYKAGISIIIDVTLKNTTSTTMNNVYYMRTVDPDNNAEQDLEQNFNDPSLKYTTVNTILSQGNDGSGVASITASQAGKTGVFTASQLALSGYGLNARVAYGGERNRDPSAVYSGTDLLKQTGSNEADESISIAYKFDQIAPGNSVTFRTGYLLADIPTPVIDIDEDNSSGLTGSQYTQIYSLGSPSIKVSDSDITVEGTGFTSLESMVVSLTNPHTDDLLTLTGNLPSGISINADSSDTEIRLSGTASSENYASALQQISFINENTKSNTDNRNITVQVFDDNYTPSNAAISIIEIITPITINDAAIANDNIVNTSEQTDIVLSGAAAPNLPITIIFTDKNGNKVTVNTTTDDDGNWTLEDSPADISGLNDGPVTVDISSTDDNGNTSTFTKDIEKDASIELSGVTPADNETVADSSPTFTGKTDPNAEITLSYGDEVLTTTADENGDWSITLPEQPLGETIDVEIVSTDPAGNTSTINRTITTPKLPLELEELDKDANGILTTTTPVFSGTSDPDTKITVTVPNPNGSPVTCTTTTDASGNWSCPMTPLPSGGPYTATIKTEDDKGNTNTTSVDIIVPELPLTVSSPSENATVTRTPEFSGTSTPNTEVTITASTGQTCTTTTDNTGSWSCTLPSIPLGEELTITATTEDSVGNKTTTEFNVKTDELPLDVTDIDTDENGLATSTAPTFAGTGEAGANIVVVISVEGGTKSCNTNVDAEGNWSCQFETLPSGGPYPLTVTTTDAFGNANSADKTISIPEIPLAVVSPSENAVISDTTPTFSGTSTPGTKVTVKASTGQSCSVITDASGSWNCTIPTLPLGEKFTITATTEDDAGNKTTKVFDIETDKLPLDVKDIDTDENGLATSTTPTFTGTGEPGAAIAVVIDADGAAKTCNTTVDAEGAWSCQFEELTSGGPYPLTVTTTDAFGNTNSVDKTISIPEISLSISSPAEDAVISAATPTVSGTSTPGTEVTVEASTGQTCTTTTDATGAWSCTLANLPRGEKITLTATTEDSAGNKTSKTFEIETENLPLDVTDLDTDDNGVAKSTTPTLTGTGEAGTNIDIVVDLGDGATASCNTTVDDEGNWSCQFDELPSGQSYPITITTTDDLGNSNSAEKTISIPEVPLVIISPSDNAVVAGASPTISGTSTPGTKVTVTASTGQTCTAVTASTNHWSCELPTLPLNESFILTVTTEDNGGNQTTKSINISTDKLPLAIIAPGDKGTAGDSTPNFVGTSSPDAVITVSASSGESCQATADAQGNWTCELPQLPAGGPYDITIKAEDSIGNVTIIEESISIPETPLVVTSPTNDETFIGNDIVITGTTDPNTEITVLGADGESCKTISSDNGAWSCVLENVQAGTNKRITVLSGNDETSLKVKVIHINIQNSSEKVTTVLEGGGGSSSIILMMFLSLIPFAKLAVRRRRLITSNK